jgi:hypothetical protein
MISCPCAAVSGSGGSRDAAGVASEPGAADGGATIGVAACVADVDDTVGGGGVVGEDAGAGGAEPVPHAVRARQSQKRMS